MLANYNIYVFEDLKANYEVSYEFVLYGWSFSSPIISRLKKKKKVETKA